MVDNGYWIFPNATVIAVTDTEKIHYNAPCEGFAKNMEGPG